MVINFNNTSNLAVWPLLISIFLLIVNSVNKATMYMYDLECLYKYIDCNNFSVVVKIRQLFDPGINKDLQ